MGKFVAANIKPIEYDLIGAPKIDPDTGKLNGVFTADQSGVRGKIPEPDPDQNKHFAKCLEEAEAMSAGDDLYERTRDKVTEALVDLGFPEDIIAQAPPRLFRALCQHVLNDLSGESAPVG